MTAIKKHSIENNVEKALVAVEMANEALSVFGDQPWSAPVQLALFALKLMILIYLKSAAEHEPEPASDPAAAGSHSTADAAAPTVDAQETATDSQRTSDPDDPPANEQSRPEQ
ncbi:hypothetical protein [Lentzea terrae]|uniref:hypothetical protein n=1 Tax=Lentzea terrae TaxID=2200761 RepID=UPI000DD2F71B|nr:hypothetical protein [Lentzea terrae]